MKKMLVTGGTVFVSRYIAEYYIANGYDVYVLNRNSRKQPAHAKLIEADRHNLGEILKNYYFDIIIDTAYSATDVSLLLDAVGGYEDYILISSSAVYPQWGIQPFTEETELGANKYWGKYGTDKIEAEKTLLQRNPRAYILRPPYLYGPMNNVYREAFVFDCAMQSRPFYIPQDGKMQLQFFHVKDMCKFIEIILNARPNQHIFNVGNKESVSVCEWVEMCYHIVGKKVQFVNIYHNIEQRNYFSFYNYQYFLDVSKQYQIMENTVFLQDGLKECFNWYQQNVDKVSKKPFLNYIDTNFRCTNENK
ncbi:MAG: NAD-dependent epimerase/dehydratase family protein [Oscillospiraceae bacterium]|nr:NAD-dependent epimerase/dehydratase family protein [Oscillospiraceae bacterium]